MSLFTSTRYIRIGHVIIEWVKKNVIQRVDHRCPSVWKFIWLFYLLITFTLLGICLYGDEELSPVETFLIKDIPHTIEEIREDVGWEYRSHLSRCRNKDPCWGYTASVQSCIDDLEDKTDTREKDPCGWDRVFDHFGSERNLEFLFEILGLDPKYFTLSQIFDSANAVKECFDSDDLLNGLCEEQIAASKVYAILHKFCRYDSDRYLSIDHW